MANSWKPKGYSSVSPYLTVSNVRSVMDFLEETFSATVLRRHDRPDGSIMHVDIQVLDTVVMIGGATNKSSETVSQLYVYVPDVNSVYLRPIEAGGLSVQEPMKREGDPDRRGGVKDPAGNTWWIATQEE